MGNNNTICNKRNLKKKNVNINFFFLITNPSVKYLYEYAILPYSERDVYDPRIFILYTLYNWINIDFFALLSLVHLCRVFSIIFQTYNNRIILSFNTYYYDYKYLTTITYKYFVITAFFYNGSNNPFRPQIRTYNRYNTINLLYYMNFEFSDRGKSNLFIGYYNPVR